MIMDISTSFIWVIILSDEAYKCGDGAEFWGYVAINAEPLCAYVCNGVLCHNL
jgi:hypothetical protein